MKLIQSQNVFILLIGISLCLSIITSRKFRVNKPNITASNNTPKLDSDEEIGDGPLVGSLRKDVNYEFGNPNSLPAWKIHQLSRKLRYESFMAHSGADSNGRKLRKGEGSLEDTNMAFYDTKPLHFHHLFPKLKRRKIDLVVPPGVEVQQPEVAGSLPGFSCSKDAVSSQIDPLYKFISLKSADVNVDNSLTLYVRNTENETLYQMKSFFEGDPKNCQLQKKKPDGTYSSDVDDYCRDSKILYNRLYQVPENTETIDKKTAKKKFKDVNLPVCAKTNTNTVGNKALGAFMSLPIGIDLKTKCFHAKINSFNSCIPIIKRVTLGILHTLHIFNEGESLFDHGNIIAENVFYKKDKNSGTIFMNNRKHDAIVHDGKDSKNLAKDLDQLGDLLISLIAGTDEVHSKIKLPFTGAHDIYRKLKKYLLENQSTASLDTSVLNMPNSSVTHTSKVIFPEEQESRMQGTVFELIARLKNRNMQNSDPFRQLSQINNHSFLTSEAKSLLNKIKPGNPNNVEIKEAVNALEGKESSPADY